MTPAAGAETGRERRVSGEGFRGSSTPHYGPGAHHPAHTQVEGAWAKVVFLLFFHFYFLAVLRGMQDLSSPTKDRTWALGSGSAES